MRTLMLLLFLAGCPASPTPTGATCPDADPVNAPSLTWDNFGHDFMFKYCTNCHASDLPHSMRNGAPIYHDFDTEIGVIEVDDHVDEQTGWGPNAQNNFMPGAGTNNKCPSVAGGPLDEACPEPTADERTKLAQWIACEKVTHPHP